MGRLGPVVRHPAGQIPTVLALWGVTWWFLSWAAERHGYFDLKVYYGAINFWAHGHGELYDYILYHSTYGFTYPPFAALTMLPMAVVPWPVAIAISLVLNAAASACVLYWLLGPVARRRGWSRWFTLAVAAAFAAAFEPMRETVNFGQVNMLLLALVAGDLLLLVRGGRRWAGVLIGLATAIKLTPGLFILYLLLTRRYRAAVTASVTAAAATLFAAAVIPDASREFWTDALWNTSRIGSQSFISNQSLNGFVARLDPTEPSKALWLVLALAALGVWAWRIRRAVAVRDEFGGLALTGVAGCLVSPITWIHHLVWLLPALALLFDRAMDSSLPARRRWRWLALTAGLYALLCSRLVWQFAFHFGGWGLLGANAYVYASVLLLFVTPMGRSGASRPGVADLGDRGGRELLDPDRAVGDEAVPLVEPSGRLVGLDHP